MHVFQNHNANPYTSTSGQATFKQDKQVHNVACPACKKLGHLYLEKQIVQKVVCQQDKELFRVACPTEKLSISGGRTDSYF
jgi:hypothetical protein